MRLSYLLPANDSSLLTEVHTLDILTIPTDCSINMPCDIYPAQNSWNTLIHLLKQNSYSVISYLPNTNVNERQETQEISLEMKEANSN